MSKILQNVVQEINIQNTKIPPIEYTELFHFFQTVLAVSAPLHYELVNGSSATEMYPDEPPQLALALTHNKRYERNFKRIQKKLTLLVADLDTNVHKIIFQSDLYDKLSDEISRITMLLDHERDELMQFYYEEIESRQLSDDDPEIGMFRAMCQMVKEQVSRYSPRSLNKQLPGLSSEYQAYRDCFSPRLDPGIPKPQRSPLITLKNAKHCRRKSF